MRTTGKENLKEMDTKTGEYKGDHLGRETRKTMTHAACCKWIPRIIYLILTAFIIKFLDAPSLTIVTAGLPDGLVRLIQFITNNSP